MSLNVFQVLNILNGITKVIIINFKLLLFVPSGAIRCAADSIVQITHTIQRLPTLQAWLKIIQNSKQSINGKSISYLCFVLELRSGYKRVFISVGSQFWEFKARSRW